MTRILYVGQKPETVDFSDPSLPPDTSAEKINAGIAKAKDLMLERGWQPDLCMITPDDAGVAELNRQISATRYDCVVIGGGLPEADMGSLYEVHFKGPLFLTEKLAPLMNDGGRIVNISSGLARFCSPNRIGYGAIKAGVEGLTRYMAYEQGGAEDHGEHGRARRHRDRFQRRHGARQSRHA